MNLHFGMSLLAWRTGNAVKADALLPSDVHLWDVVVWQERGNH